MKRQVTNNLFEFMLLFNLGGFIYYMIEILARGYSHWTMFLLGGLCFLIVGAINNFLPWEMYFEVQSILGAGIITVLEFITGIIVNIILGWNVWDYSDRPFNLLGQICLPFSLIWIVLSAVIIIVDDYIRYKLFKEKKPYYISWIINKIRGDNK